jgi:hypothetical protein
MDRCINAGRMWEDAVSNLNMTRALCAAIITVGLTASAAFAQQPGRIRGQIEKADGAMLSVKTNDGKILTVKVADDVRLSSLAKTTLADIKNDSYIGVAGMARPDGSIEAFSIHVLLPAARGNGEGERPWDAKPGSTMTNAYLESSVASADGHTLMVKYKGSEKKVIVTPATVLAQAGPADKSELKPGAQIIVMAAAKQPDDSYLAKVIYVGRGMKPAM